MPVDWQAAEALKKKLGRGSVNELMTEDFVGAGWNRQDAIRAGSYNKSIGYQAPTVEYKGASGQGKNPDAPVTYNYTASLTQPQKPAAPTTPVQDKHAAPAPAAQAPAPATATVVPMFNYRPSTRTEEQLLSVARARARMQIGTQRQDAQAAFAQSEQRAAQDKTQVARNAAGLAERAREQWGSRNLGTSGFMAGANALNAAAAQNQMGQIQGEQRLAHQALSARLGQLNQIEQQAEVANFDQLLAQERAYGMQDRAQQFGEFSSDRSFGRGVLESDRNFDLNRQSTESNLASQALARRRGELLLPYEVGGASLANQQATFNLQNAQTMQPYNIVAAALANRAAQAQYTDQYETGGLGYQARQAQVTAANLANDANATRNRITELEATIAESPDVGLKERARLELQQAQANLRQIEANIKATNALATQRLTEGSGSSGTKLTGRDIARQYPSVNAGWTWNYNALDEAIKDVMQGAQTGQVRSYQDVAELLDDPDTAESLSKSGVDPTALLQWATANLPDRETNRMIEEGNIR